MSCNCIQIAESINGVFEYTNVNAARMDFKIQNGSTFHKWFRFIEGTTPIDVSLLSNVVMELKVVGSNTCGNVVATYRLGDGFTVYSNDSSLLIMYKKTWEKNIAPGTYAYELRLEFASGRIEIPLQGYYTSI